MEYLGANSLIIQLGNGRLSSRDKHVSAPAFVKACQRDDQEIAYRVSLAETVIVPARHEMVMPAKVVAQKGR